MAGKNNNKQDDSNTSTKLIDDIEKMEDVEDVEEVLKIDNKIDEIKLQNKINNVLNKIKLKNFKNLVTPQRIGFSLAGIFIFILVIIVSFIINKNKDLNEQNIVNVPNKSIEKQVVVNNDKNTQIVVKQQVTDNPETKNINYKEKNIDISLMYKLNKLFTQKVEINDSKIYFTTIVNSDKYKELINSIKTTNDNNISKLLVNNINDLIKLGATPSEINKFCLSTNKQIETLVKLINPKKALEYNKKQELFFVEYANLQNNYLNNYSNLFKDLSIPKEDDFIMNLQNEILKVIELEN